MTRPHPDLWYPIAALLSALRKLLRATAPGAFSHISREARAQLAAVTALVRRYIHVLAAEIVLLPPQPSSMRPENRKTGQGARRALFPLIEYPSKPSRSGPGSQDPPELQWALMLEAAERLVSVLADPARHAHRLARRFGTLTVPGLRDLPVPWHVTRRLPPALDTLLCRADAIARPEAWAGIWTDTS